MLRLIPSLNMPIRLVENPLGRARRGRLPFDVVRPFLSENAKFALTARIITAILSGRLDRGLRSFHHGDESRTPANPRQHHAALQRLRRRARHQSRRRRRRTGGAARPVRLRKVDPAADHVRLHSADRRPRAVRRPAGRSSVAEPARRRHRVPELRAVSAHDGCGKRRLRPAGAQMAAREDRAARRRDARARPHERIRAAQAAAIVRRPAAAHRAGALPRDRSEGAAARRAVRRARQESAARHADRGQAAVSANPASPPSWSRTTRKRRCRWPTASR